MTRLATATVSIVAAATAILGGCDKLDGRNRNREGNRDFRDSNFVGAVGQYEKAVTEVDDPTIHYNLGLAYTKVFRPGYDKPVRLDVKGSNACTFIPNVQFGNADVCIKEGDTKLTDCTDLQIPGAGKEMASDPIIGHVGELLAKSDLVNAMSELRKIQDHLTDEQKKDKALNEKLDKVSNLLGGVCPSSYKCQTTNLCSLPTNALADLAVKNFEVWLAAHDDDDDTRKLMTGVWIDSGQFAKAIAYWEDRLKKDPKDAKIMGNLAGLSLKAGDWRKSIDWYNKVADLADKDDDKISAWAFIGNVSWHELKSGNLTPVEMIEAADLGAGALGKVIAKLPNSPKTFQMMGSIYNFRAMATPSSISWNIDRATARDLQLAACVLNDEAKKLNCPCKVLQVGCPAAPPPGTGSGSGSGSAGSGSGSGSGSAATPAAAGSGSGSGAGSGAGSGSGSGTAKPTTPAKKHG